MAKKVMIQTVMSLEDFTFCQDLFKNLSRGKHEELTDSLFMKRVYVTSQELKSIENLRNLFLPDITIF